MDTDKHLADLAQRAERIGSLVYSDFLDPLEIRQAQMAAHQAHTLCRIFGGYEDAERCVACFGPEYEEPEYPIVWLGCNWNAKFASPGHRDFLGALMGLGIKREALGDILIEESRACIALHDSVADYVYAELTSAGRATLSNEYLDAAQMVSRRRPLEMGEITVSSMRLDAIVAAGAKLSRTAAERLIEQGGVKVDHMPELRPDKKIAENSLLSLSGFGRLYIKEICGTTKRGRIRIQVGRPV